jgi:hypothetical protein
MRETHKPIPSKVNTAVPINSGKLCALNMATSARPCAARTVDSFAAI